MNSLSIIAAVVARRRHWGCAQRGGFYMKMRTIHVTAAAEQLWRSTRGGHSPSIETLKRMLFAGIALALLATAAPADAAAKTRDECTPPVVSVLDVKPVPDKIDEAP